MSDRIHPRPERGTEAEPEGEFLVSNAMALSGRQIGGLAIFAAALVVFLPAAWKRIEPLPRGAEYRIPYQLSGDYWLFERVARDSAKTYDTLILGDSVVWGQYVTPGQTLPHYLNVEARSERFANLGVDGMHPAALAGLIEYHAKDIAAKDVILHCNPLWLSSTKHDLRGEEEFDFNHPELVPQFFPGIPCYRDEVSRRIGRVVERNVSFLDWTRHLQLAYFEQRSVPEWTKEHPYTSPLRALTYPLPIPGDRLRHRPVPWTEQGIRKQDFPWVELEESFQWRSFRRAVECLRERGNRVFVLVGPFNEHLLTEASLERYGRIREGIAAWLRERGVDHDVPPALPSDLYADASHPLAEGYRQMAARLFSLLPRD